VGQLLRTPLGQLLTIKNLGQKSRGEIEQSLKAYLAEHPEASAETLVSYVREAVFPLVDPELLSCVSQDVLDFIPLARLALPASLHGWLQRSSIRSIGDLTRQAADASEQAVVISGHLQRYLA
jgi:hypothetical protein